MKIQQLLVPIIATGLSLIPELVNAAPIQCYIGQSGAYRICDLQRKGTLRYLVVWPDRERTLIIVVSTPSGSYADVRHAYPNGTIYGGGTRYPRFHYEQGKWLCLHREPGGRGTIDFCITGVQY
ncbi:MAG: hypothetical protein AB4426_03035 [Xenococcaceae cyanobacterium]